MADILNTNYQSLLNSISDRYTNGRLKANHSVNLYLIETYWEIGRYIVEFEQGGKNKAAYGSQLLEQLSRDLKKLHP